MCIDRKQQVLLQYKSSYRKFVTLLQLQNIPAMRSCPPADDGATAEVRIPSGEQSRIAAAQADAAAWIARWRQRAPP